MTSIRLATVLAAAVIIAGCSSNDAPQEQTSTTAPSGHGTFAKCLSEHGVSAPPGPVAGPPPGTDEATWHKAEQACTSLAPGPNAG